MPGAAVVFGKAGTAVDANRRSLPAPAVCHQWTGGGRRSGISVSSAGDVLGDGLADLIVGAHLGDPAAGSDAGRNYVVFGKAVTATTSIPLGRRRHRRLRHQRAGGGRQVGISVSSAGDVNGDGFVDLIVGANKVIEAWRRPQATWSSARATPPLSISHD